MHITYIYAAQSPSCLPHSGWQSLYQANVCIICDEYICGTDLPVWLSKEKILKNKIRLSNPDLPTALSQCYQVEDEELHGILLSP